MTVTTTRVATRPTRPSPPGYRTFALTVTRAVRLGPTFLRLTLAGDELRGFGAAGDDQRIKLVLPRAGRSLPVLPSGSGDGGWYAAWLALPDDERPFLRTYTVRAFRPWLDELDVDIVLHVDDGATGPAATWASAVRPGDGAVIIGPDRPGHGSAWGTEWAPPPGDPHLLLAGDETAVPAIAAILEGLPAAARGTVCLEVPDERDVQDLIAPRGVDIRWYARCAQPHGSALVPALRAVLQERVVATAVASAAALDDVDVDTTLLWEVPDPDGAGAGDCYAWIAGEAGVVKTLRRILVNEFAVPRSCVAFMGYWRQGRAEY